VLDVGVPAAADDDGAERSSDGRLVGSADGGATARFVGDDE